MLKQLLFLGAALALAAAHAQPAAWPAAKPITLIVPFSAGGNVDTTARLIGQKLGERLKQAVVIDNVAGAGGVVGVAKAVNAAPDGYTLVMAFDGPIGITKLVNPGAVRYDAARDLAPVALTTTAPLVLVARPGLPAGNLADMIKLARAEPGRISYATSGVGTVLHLAMEMIKERGGFYAVHIPYRGGAQIVTDVVGNQVDLAMLVSLTATPHVLSGKLKGLAVTGDKRLPGLPDVPALGELPGFKGLDIVSWTGVFAPAKTPPAVVERLNHEINEVLRMDEVRKKLAEGGALVGSGDTAAFNAFLQRENAKYARIVKAANIKE
jgi:tripartite-type tricarboxylate transporter receptor subunit TctC